MQTWIYMGAALQCKHFKDYWPYWLATPAIHEYYHGKSTPNQTCEYVLNNRITWSGSSLQEVFSLLVSFEDCWED